MAGKRDKGVGRQRVIATLPATDEEDDGTKLYTPRVVFKTVSAKPYMETTARNS